MNEELSKSVGIKNDQDKIRSDLIDAYAMEQLAGVLRHGAKEYGANNWRKGMSFSRLIGALLRHVWRFSLGEDNDPDTGLCHMSHAMCNAMFLTWMVKYNAQWDDRIRNEPRCVGESKSLSERVGDAVRSER